MTGLFPIYLSLISMQDIVAKWSISSKLTSRLIVGQVLDRNQSVHTDILRSDEESQGVADT